MKNKIPVKNIFYLLSYAWEKAEWGDEKDLSAETFSSTENLFGRLFELSFTWLLRKGLSKEYITESNSGNTIRGKLLLSESIKSGALLKGQASCETDILTYNNKLNQILKSTLQRIIKIVNLDSGICQSLINPYRLLNEINVISLTESDFKDIRYNRNNRQYRFLIELCHLFFRCSNLSHEDGNVRVRDFFDDIIMSSLFEKFILNFYKLEMKEVYKVSARQFEWEESSGDEAFLNRLPTLKTDITLWNDSNSIVIETKYYLEALTSHYGAQKYSRSHLSQLKEYLREGERHLGSRPRGILLYPAVDYAISDNGKISGFDISVRTIDLSRPFSEIKANLLKMLEAASDIKAPLISKIS